MLIAHSFESEKAALWDEESVVGGETSALAGTAGVRSPGKPQGMSDPQIDNGTRGSGRGRGRGRGSGRGNSQRANNITRGESVDVLILMDLMLKL